MKSTVQKSTIGVKVAVVFDGNRKRKLRWRNSTTTPPPRQHVDYIILLWITFIAQTQKTSPFFIPAITGSHVSPPAAVIHVGAAERRAAVRGRRDVLRDGAGATTGGNVLRAVERLCMFRWFPPLSPSFLTVVITTKSNHPLNKPSWRREEDLRSRGLRTKTKWLRWTGRTGRAGLDGLRCTWRRRRL